jgi:RNA polymerase sigma-70 factor, ECF subfamily
VPSAPAAVQEALASAYSSEWARLVATLIRQTGQWTLAEDCVQDAFARALDDWPRNGIPSNTGAWLTTVARNRAIDRLRRTATENSSLNGLAIMAESTERTVGSAGAIEDDRLRLIFTCAHPALPMDARVALTLRTVAGLTNEEIARAFLVTEAAMAKRLVRARAKIKEAGIPYRVPPPALRAERTSGVLAVLYLLFNEGYSTGGVDIAAEAIRLTRLLVALMPAELEAQSLLALMLLHHARRSARTDEAGDIVTLEDQDRAAWDDNQIAEGLAILRTVRHRRARKGERAGEFQLQAAIAACHMVAPDAAATDFAQIVLLYDELLQIVPSPVIELNRAVAVALSEGFGAGLSLVDELEASGALDGYYLLPATRADLLRRLGRYAEATRQYEVARDLSPGVTEQRYFARRLQEIGAD